MPALVIQIRDHRTAFSPRDTVGGEVSWQLEALPQSAELRLLWSTSGRGTTDFAIVETIAFPHPQSVETRPFSLTLPEAPYSFSGSLITLTWTLELLIEPGNLAETIVITVAPSGQAISLPRIKPA